MQKEYPRLGSNQSYNELVLGRMEQERDYLHLLRSFDRKAANQCKGGIIPLAFMGLARWLHVSGERTTYTTQVDY